MPEAGAASLGYAFDPRHRGEVGAGHDVDRGIAIRQAEQLTVERGEFLRAIADALVLGQQDPAPAAALGDPLLVGDVPGVVAVVVGDEMNRVAGAPQSVRRDLPRLRSKKNSGRLAEDILDDVNGQAVLLGDGADPLAGTPEAHDVRHAHLGVG